MARKKVEAAPAFGNWSEVDAAMKEILECEGCIDEVEVDMNRQISGIKAEADQKTKPIRERINLLEAQIRDYVVRHRDTLNGKTQRLNFGQTGFRISTKLIIPAGKVPEVIEALRHYSMEDCLVVKESINKDVLKKYKSEDILRTGAYLRSEDEFWYEVNKEQLQAAENK